ncbi:hypothetical protein [Veillonella sp. 3310]|uniref:hypothetical protein n=1 Tax=Veillonella sp. 3310 TaxID=2490956 RepID=UPI0013DE89C5|nr:hypothetical protein [Veillonella sp. 3310]
MKELLILQLIMLVLQKFEYISVNAFWLFLPLWLIIAYTAILVILFIIGLVVKLK